MARYDDDDDDIEYTYGPDGELLYVDDWIAVKYDNDVIPGEILEIASDGRYLKVQLQTGDIVSVSLSQIVSDDTELLGEFT